MRSYLTKYSSILLIGLLFEWWIVYYSPLNLPESIPYTPIKISGLLLIALILTVLIIAEKKFFRLNEQSSIWKLTLLGGAIAFIAEVVFQLIRQPFIQANTLNERVYY